MYLKNTTTLFMASVLSVYVAFSQANKTTIKEKTPLSVDYITTIPEDAKDENTQLVIHYVSENTEKLKQKKYLFIGSLYEKDFECFCYISVNGKLQRLIMISHSVEKTKKQYFTYKNSEYKLKMELDYRTVVGPHGYRKLTGFITITDFKGGEVKFPIIGGDKYYIIREIEK